MTDGFYYLAAYTASAAAGFTQRDAAEIARAARYTEDCQGFTTPKEGEPGDGLLQVVFHYLPGDAQDILEQVRPDFFNEAGPLSAAALRLVCRPGGLLLDHLASFAKKGWLELLAEEPKHQRLGIAAHMVLDACLHLGFAGVDDPMVNGAAGILSAASTPPEGRRALLERTRTEPLAEIFQMQPAAVEPQAGTMGCEQVRTLVEAPSAIFTYESPWRREPVVSCVNPIRYAGAYLILKAFFQYIRESRKEWTVEEADEDAVLDLAVFFSGLPDERTMEAEWPLYFGWLSAPPPYEEPRSPDEEPYLRHFKYQALELRSRITDACQDLRTYERLMQASQPDDAPEEPEPKKAEDETAPDGAGGQEG